MVDGTAVCLVRPSVWGSVFIQGRKKPVRGRLRGARWVDAYGGNAEVNA